MPDYQKLYTLMFNAVTDALDDLQSLNLGAAKDKLLSAQLRAEALYMSPDRVEDRDPAGDAG